METVVDRYTLGQRIGSGGMGDVFRGLDEHTHTAVAIKVLKSELATQEMVQRFVREGETLRQLNHPNIVKLLDAVQEDGRYYLIMELVDGGSLDEILAQTPRLPINEVLNIALDLADALTRAHRLNIIHRDIKPANVLLTKDRMLRLTDFGIARVVGSNITETGSVLGTIAYIAPEVFQGRQADARSDIWSMGLMLFEMLAGEHPFKLDQDVGGLIQSILNTPLPDLEALRPDAPTALVDLINRMVMKDPAERIPRMRLVGSELEAILANERNVTASDDTLLANLLVKIEPASRFATPPGDLVEAKRHNLPVQTTPFVGREAELGELENILHDASVRLLSIVGPGGMGKTRLSLEVAGKFLHSALQDGLFEHGLYFIDLTPVTSPDHIIGVAAEAVGYTFQQDGREVQQQLLDYLREKNMLLIVDNFEHVIAGRTFVQEVLQAAPSVKILVTSREKLNLNSETVFILSGMSFPAWETPVDATEYGAVKLFLQSARRVRHDFQLDTDALMYIARICRMVLGTPLGILLAASWLEVLTLREIVEEISGSLDFLETEMHDLPERQRSLRAVFEYSWNLLTEQEQMLFAQFSMFHGGFTRDAGLKITGTNLRALTTLVNKSLLRRDNGSGRYEVHELLRQYAEEKLEQSAQRAASHQTYSRYYLELINQFAPKLKGYGQLEALNLIDTDFENIRAAWNWAVQQENAATIEAAIEGLYLYLTFRSRLMDGDQMFAAARQVWRSDSGNVSLLAGKLLVRFPQGPPLAQYRHGLAIAGLFGDAAETAFCQSLLGYWLSHIEFNQMEGIPLLEASVRGFEALDNKFNAAQVLDDLGWSFRLSGDVNRQEPAIQKGLDLRREIGDRIGVANSLRNLGGTGPGLFDGTEHGVTYWEEAKKVAYEVNDRLSVAWNASMIAANLICKIQFDRAEALLDEAYPHALDLNHAVVKGFILLQRAAIVALRNEDYAAGKRLIMEGFPPGSMDSFHLFYVPYPMAIVACGLHDFTMFRPSVDRILKSPFNKDDYLMAFMTACRVVQVADRGEDVRAVELLHGYWNFTPWFSGRPVAMKWSRNWGLLKRLDAQLEAKLGSTAFEAAVKRGEALTESELKQEVRNFLEDLLD